MRPEVDLLIHCNSDPLASFSAALAWVQGATLCLKLVTVISEKEKETHWTESGG